MTSRSAAVAIIRPKCNWRVASLSHHTTTVYLMAKRRDRQIYEVAQLLGSPDGFTQRLTLLSIFDFLITRIPDQIRTPPWKGVS